MCVAGVFMGQQHVWTAGSWQQPRHGFLSRRRYRSLSASPVPSLIHTFCHVINHMLMSVFCHSFNVLTAHCVLSVAVWLDGLRVWDVSAGQSHSLLLADGDCVPAGPVCTAASIKSLYQRRGGRPTRVNGPARGHPAGAETYFSQTRPAPPVHGSFVPYKHTELFLLCLLLMV